MGRTHWGDPADPPGQWQEHQGHWSEPCQAASGTMANVTRNHGSNRLQVSRYTVTEGVACQAELPRNSGHKSEAVVP